MLNFAVTNMGNIGKEIYLWHRVGKELCLFKDKSFFPYYYQLDSMGALRTIDNKKVRRILCAKPSDVARRRDEESYEADILFTKRYVIDRVISFPKADLKYSFIDIEVTTKELPSYLNPNKPISCISCSNSYTTDIKTFYLDAIDEASEKQLLNEFVKWLREEQFDILLGWNFVDFDYLYLSARYKKLFNVELAEMLSPIAQSRPIHKANSEESILFPVGLSIVDYLDLFKKAYRNETSYALDSIAQKYLKETTYQKVDFAKVSTEIRDKNRNDIRRLVELEKEKKLIEYYDELRRMSMCEWMDVTWNSKMIDMILLKEAKQKGIILPSKKYGANQIEVEDTFEGAYRRCDILDEEGNIIKKNTGLYKNLWKLDLSSAYPMAITEFCLDTSNIRPEGTDINGIKFYQNNNALLPTIAQKMINKKDTLKKQLKELNPESKEYEDLHIKYDAIKAVVNSLFGVCGLKIFRLFDYRVASSITFLVRDLLHYVEDKLQEKGMKVIYIDTDSVFVDAKENPKDLCNTLIQQWAKEKYNKESTKIEFDCEGIYEKIFIVTMCRYKGYLRKKSGLEEEKKGLELKRSDSSEYIREFQNNLIEKIMNEETKEEIIRFINDEKIRIKSLPLTMIGFPCKINAEKEYKSIPIFMRALEYTKELVSDFDKRPGDQFFYIFVGSLGKAQRKSSRMKKNKETGKKELQTSDKEVEKDVLAFDEDRLKHVKNIDWNRMIERSIMMKCENIFEALEWELSNIKEVKEKKVKIAKVKKAQLTKEESYIKHEKEVIEHALTTKCLPEVNVLSKVDIIKEETLIINKEFKVLNAITERTIQSAEAFGLGIDSETAFVIYKDCKLKYKQGDIIYVTGDSGSGKSWILKNVFAKLENSICIDDVKIDDDEVIIEGVGKNISDALAKLNVAGLGDAFLYLRKYNQLSDGQKYRYKIAKFIDNEDKDVWILDEFCATLDRVTAKVISYNLQKIARKLGKTVICATTHDDLLEELRPNTYLVKGYESDIVITYYDYSKWAKTKLSFYNDIKISKGTIEDYEQLKRFHYRQAHLGARKAIYKMTYKDSLIGVIVICYPHLALKGRNIAMNNELAKMTKENCKKLNDEFDSIARIIVHPKFRGIGLAQYFLQEYFKLTDATYVETVAVMAGYNPFFERAGMTRVNVEDDDNRVQAVKQLESYGFDIRLLSSQRYCQECLLKLNSEQQREVTQIVKKILNKYKGQIAKLFSNDQTIDEIVENNLSSVMKELQRANIIYLIKKLK